MPIEKNELKRFEYFGYPKNGHVTIEVAAKPVIVIPTDTIYISVARQTELDVNLIGQDDLQFKQLIEWSGEKGPKLDVAKVLWWRPLDMWQNWLQEEYSRTQPGEKTKLHAVVELRLRFCEA